MNFLPWSEATWLEEVHGWIGARLDVRGRVEVLRLRPWSAVLRVPTTEGVVWFKESAPCLAFEPALTELLVGRRPDCNPDVLALEGPRMLTRDVGPQLRTLLEAGEAAPSWEEIVELYAEVQIELVGDVADLLALGVPDSRPQTLGAPFGGPVPLTLIHEEVHDGNVFVRDGSPVFIDWAEASISHPFAGLINTLRQYSYRRAYEPGGPEVLRLRDAYLERWTTYAPLDELRELFRPAYALGALARAATWERLLMSLPPEERGDYEHNIGAWREIHADALRAPDRLGE